jgi:hypothetical protein
MGLSLVGDRIVIAFPVLKFHLIDMAYNLFTLEVPSGSNVRYGSGSGHRRKYEGIRFMSLSGHAQHMPALFQQATSRLGGNRRGR